MERGNRPRDLEPGVPAPAVPEPGGRVLVEVDVPETPYCATGVDLIADQLFSLGAAAVAELGSDETEGATTPRVVADLPLASLPALDGIGMSYALIEVDPTVAATWQTHATAVEIGERLSVRPVWVTPGSASSERVEVVVDAADVFGSGSHPTTRLCLEAVERFVRPSDRVLDVGCGAGVLGVAALLLGAGSLAAIDVEPEAVAATRRTADLNGVRDRLIEVSTRSIADVVGADGPFDLVVANLLVPVIESLGSDLGRAVTTGGRIVLGGLLDQPSGGGRTSGVDAGASQVDRAIDAVGATTRVEAYLRSDGWTSVVLEHRGDHGE